MLYYLPIGKITIKGEFKTGDLPDKLKITSSQSANKGKPANGEKPSEDTTTITGGSLTITLTSEVEPDGQGGEYYVIPHANYIYDDEMRLTVNAKHLLSTGDVTSEDKTVEVVGTLASMAGVFRSLSEGVTPPPTPTPPPPPFYFSFHPSNPQEVADVEEALTNREIYFKLTYLGEKAGGKQIFFSTSDAQQLGQEGLIFRPGIPYTIELRYPKGAGFDRKTTLIHTTRQFVLPDMTRVYEIKYNRMPFVKKVKDIGFSDGMLTDYAQKVPSPILGFLGIPKAIVQAIVPIPGTHSTGSASSTGTSAAH